MCIAPQIDRIIINDDFMLSQSMSCFPMGLTVTVITVAHGFSVRVKQWLVDYFKNGINYISKVACRVEISLL